MKNVGLATVKDDPIGVASCSCGWAYAHHRIKVREDAIERHLKKKHNGRGVWI